jgi:hypothetical protein
MPPAAPERPHCRRWHPVFRPHTEGTATTLTMLYWECRGLRYFAGFSGSPTRHPSRRTTEDLGGGPTP